MANECFNLSSGLPLSELTKYLSDLVSRVKGTPTLWLVSVLLLLYKYTFLLQDKKNFTNLNINPKYLLSLF